VVTALQVPVGTRCTVHYLASPLDQGAEVRQFATTTCEPALDVPRNVGFRLYKGLVVMINWTSHEGASGAIVTIHCEGGTALLGIVVGNCMRTGKAWVEVLDKDSLGAIMARGQECTMTVGVRIPESVATGKDPHVRSWAA
jgi:hypothetical protein